MRTAARKKNDNQHTFGHFTLPKTWALPASFVRAKKIKFIYISMARIQNQKNIVLQISRVCVGGAEMNVLFLAEL